MYGLVVTIVSYLCTSLQVLKISPLGHRKRIIASLAERPYEEAPTKSQISHRLSQIRVSKSNQCLTFEQ